MGLLSLPLTSLNSTSQTGLLPGIVSVLQSHSNLAQDAMDADSRREALLHLLECRNFYRQLASLANEGRLPEAIQHYEVTKDVLDSTPPSLSKASVTLDMKVRFACSAWKVVPNTHLPPHLSENSGCSWTGFKSSWPPLTRRV